MALTKNQKDTVGFRLESFKKLKAKKGPLKEEEVAEALKAFKGLQWLAAEALDVTQARVSQMITASPMLQELRDSLLERRIDVAEYNLSELNEEKDLGSIIWFLKTRGKHRGYIETEVAKQPAASEEVGFKLAEAKELNGNNLPESKASRQPQERDSED